MGMRWMPIAAAALALAVRPAFPANSGKAGPAGECIQTSRGTVYDTITNDKYQCEIRGNRLLIVDFGRKVPAPEGTYRNLPDGNRCFVGKGGFILSCSRR